MLKLDANGIINWEKSFGTQRDELANCVIQTQDDGYLMGGYDNLACDEFATETQNKMYLIRLNTNVITSYEDEEEVVESSTFSLYPNPSSGVIHLSGIPAGSVISIYNAQGKLITQQISTTITSFDISAYSSGIYYCIAQSNNKVITQKIIKQ